MPTLTLPKLEKPVESVSPFQQKARISFVSYGVHIGIKVDEPAILARIPAYLPPGWELNRSPVVDELYSISVTGDYYQLDRELEQLAYSRDLEDILETLDSDLRIQVAIGVRDKLFVHAGVVGWQGKAIVIPGRSFSGKTMLVAALIKAGATYYSDEYAVLDVNGLVHPYPRRLSIRQGERQRTKRCHIEELGGKSGIEPLPVGWVVYTQYQPGMQWQPIRMSMGETGLALLDNTVVARLRPEFALPILSRVVLDALGVKGGRGDADETAKLLLEV